MNTLIKDFLNKNNIFAVIGVSRNPNKYGNKVYLDLKKAGYKTRPINPKINEIYNNKCYPTLESLPEKPDVVVIVVPSNIANKIVQKCHELGIKKIWMQPGSESQEAINFCKTKKIKVLHNACIMIKRKHSWKKWKKTILKKD